MKLDELNDVFRDVENMIKECAEKGLAIEMIFIEGLPNLKKKYGLDNKYYEKKMWESAKKLKTNGDK